jgi:hypothetical protein
MSEEKVTLELLGARVLALTADVRDLQQRFSGLEARLGGIEARLGGIEARLGGIEGRVSGMETRFAVQEERMTRVLAFVVRIAERLDGRPNPA